MVQMFAMTAHALAAAADPLKDLPDALKDALPDPLNLKAEKQLKDDKLAIIINHLVDDANKGNLNNPFVDPVVKLHASNLDKAIDRWDSWPW
jgi:hypothetical protein